MSKQTLIIVAVLLLTFGSGIGCGLYLGASSADSSASTKNGASSWSGYFTDAAAQSRVEANTLLSTRIRELEKELAEQKGNQNKSMIQADRFDFFKRHHQQIRFQAIDGDLKGSPEIVEILGLSKDEQHAIQQNLTSIKDELNKFNDANTTLVKQTANSVSYEIPTNPQAKALKDNLTSQLAADIGTDRAEVFLDYSDFSPYSQFAGLAGQKKDIDISWTQQNGKPMYTVKNSFFGPDGNSQGWSSSSSPVLSQEDQKLLEGNSGP